MNNNDEKKFIELFNVLKDEIHKNAKNKGFWDDDELIKSLNINDEYKKIFKNNKDGTMIALMVSELSEALEALRKGNPNDNKLSEFKNSTVELADCIIRIIDFAGARNLRLCEAIIEKVKYNKTRSYKHGKEF